MHGNRAFQCKPRVQVVMATAAFGRHLVHASTLDICLPSLKVLANDMPPSNLAVLVRSFGSAPWAPRSLMRSRLVAAAFRALPRCVACLG